MRVREIELLTGWSRATIYRRMAEPDFPAPLVQAVERTWNPVEIIEWVTRFNLRATFGVQAAARFEEALAQRAELDPLVQSPIGRAMEREKAIRAANPSLHIALEAYR